MMALKIKKTKYILIVCSCISLFLIVGLIINYIIVPNNKFSKAINLIENEKYEEAYKILLELKPSSKVKKYLNRFEFKIVKVLDEKNNVVELYEYDENGNLILEKKVYEYFLWHSNSEEYEAHVYSYDENNNLIRDVYTKKSDVSGSSIVEDSRFSYDEKGNCIQKYSSLNDYSYFKTYYYSYDDRGQLIKEICYMDDEINSETTYDYDKYGKLLVEKCYTSGMYDMDYILKYIYNANNKLVKTEKIYCDINFSETIIDEYLYDERDNLILKSEGRYASYQGREITYKYDDKNNCIEENDDYGNGYDVINCKYRYDNYGNKVSTSRMEYSELGGTIEYHTLTCEYNIFYNNSKKSQKSKDCLTTEIEVESIEENIKLIDEDKIYNEKIEEYKNAFLMDYESFYEKFQDDCSSINAYCLRDLHQYGGTLAYSLFDIDKNGVDELIISDMSNILDIYSYNCENSKIVKLFENCYFGERERIHILSTGALFTEGANSASSSSLTKYYIVNEQDELKVKEIVSYYFDETQYIEDESDWQVSSYNNLISQKVYFNICDSWLRASMFGKLEWKEILSK